jgi:hypothetical protein
MFYKRRSQNRDTFTIIRDYQEQTFSTPSAIVDLTSRIASQAAAAQTSTEDEDMPSGVPYRQAIAERQ